MNKMRGLYVSVSRHQ